MKILYIAHYKENSGWAKTAIDHILCLDKAGIDVVCRSVDLTATNGEIPERIKELEQKDLNNIDYCIQYLLPGHMVGTGKFKKNIGYFVSENSTIKHLWLNDLRQMDEIWVPNNQNKEVLINDGLKNVKVVPYAFDLGKYTKENRKIDLHPVSNKYKFYFIGSLEDRKNIESLIRAYYSEFKNGEQVCLVLKLRRFMMPENEIMKAINDISSEIKRRLRIYDNPQSYAPHVVWAEDIKDDAIQSLHSTCDCYVTMSHGEGWDVPAFEAMCYGKTPICGKEGGHLEYVDNDINNGTLINGIYNVCDNQNAAFKEIGTGREEWFCPSESEMKKAMRFYFENRDKINRKSGLSNAEQFSYENVAKKIKEELQ